MANKEESAHWEAMTVQTEKKIEIKKKQKNSESTHSIRSRPRSVQALKCLQKVLHTDYSSNSSHFTTHPHYLFIVFHSFTLTLMILPLFFFFFFYSVSLNDDGFSLMCIRKWFAVSMYAYFHFCYYCCRSRRCCRHCSRPFFLCVCTEIVVAIVSNCRSRNNHHRFI